VLGVSNALQNGGIEIVNELRDALACVDQLLGSQKGRFWVSDGFFFVPYAESAVPISKENQVLACLRACATAQLALAERGLLSRGGITYGDIAFGLGSGFVFGPALTRAAEIEGETKMPRVALDSCVVTCLQSFDKWYANSSTPSPRVPWTRSETEPCHGNEEHWVHFPALARELLCLDEQHSLLVEIRKSTLERLPKAAGEKVRKKHRWFQGEVGLALADIAFEANTG